MTTTITINIDGRAQPVPQAVAEALHVCRCVLLESLEHHGKLSADKARHGLRMIDRANAAKPQKGQCND